LKRKLLSKGSTKVKNIFLPLFTLFLLVSCNQKNEIEKEIDTIPISIEIDRFDQDYFNSSVLDLPKIKTKYPHFFPEDIPDSVWIEQKQDTIFMEIYQEVYKKFPNNKQLEQELISLFKHINYYFPNEKIPKINTVIAGLDFESNVFYNDSIVVISLDLYLGKDHRFYHQDSYLRTKFEPRQMMPNLVKAFAQKKITYPNPSDFLSVMIYQGKILYLKDLLIPDFSDIEKINYSEQDLKWAYDNEENIWRYFIDNRMLYSSDVNLLHRFINTAPFSKFYLDIDNESPGRIGAWIGWQIVRSFVKNNPQIHINELLEKEADELFKKSKYKPNL